MATFAQPSFSTSAVPIVVPIEQPAPCAGEARVEVREETRRILSHLTNFLVVSVPRKDLESALQLCGPASIVTRMLEGRGYRQPEGYKGEQRDNAACSAAAPRRRTEWSGA